jgi:hypothetical protein
MFGGSSAQSIHFQVHRTIATVQEDLTAGRGAKLYRNPTASPRMFGGKRYLMRRDVYRHVLRGLQLHHVPIAFAVHNQDIRHTQRGSGF